MKNIIIKLSLIFLLVSCRSWADNCLDVFPRSSQENSNLMLNLLPNNGSDGHLMKNGNAQDNYSPGDYFHLSGQLSGNYQLQALGLSSRIYFTSLSSSGTVSINTAHDSQNLIILVDGDIQLSGNTSYKAIIYATGNITLKNNVHINGAVTALGSIQLKNNASITYNQQAIEQADFATLCSNGTSSSNQFAFGSTTSSDVVFQEAFSTSPVIILMPTIRQNNSTSDGPSNLQLLSVSKTGFSFSQIEPPGNTISGKTMLDVHWLAFAPGVGSLPDGQQYEAGFTNLNNYQAKSGSPSWYRQSLSAGFANKPELFHQKQSQINNCWLTSISNEGSTTDFNLALEVSEVFDNWWDQTCAPGWVTLDSWFFWGGNSLSPERIGWVAMEAHKGSYTENGTKVTYQVGRANNTNNQSNATTTLSQQCAHNNNFGVTFSSAPILIAKKISRLGGDGGWIRRCALSPTSFSAVVDEDQYQDNERNHLRENISFFALSASTNVSTPGLRFENTQTDALSCDPHAITVQALLDDQADASYLGTITLRTGTGLGSWALTNGGGTFSAGNNNGEASYTFSALDKGRASFSLFHSLEGLVGVTTADGPVTDEMTITFRPFGFRTSLDSGMAIFDANTDQNINLQAVGKDESQAGCAIISNYSGNKNISFWSDYENPTQTAGTPLKVNGSPIANNETAAASSIQSINFTAGVANLTLNYPDAGQLKLNTKDAEGIAPPNTGGTGGAIIGGSSFIVKPSHFYFSEIKNDQGQANTSGNSTAGNGFSAAGGDFSSTITAVMNKGALNCIEVEAGSAYCITPSFEHPQLTLSHQLLSPLGGNTGNLQGISNKAMTAGKVIFDQMSFSEAGSIRLAVIAKDYLNSGNNITGQSPEIGRFYPDSIALNASLVSPTCNNFSYMDQAEIGLDYELYALNRDNELTLNYHWPDYSFEGIFTEYAGNGSDDLSARLNSLSNTAHWMHGKYQISNKLIGINKLSTPDGPFDNTSIGLKFIGFDGETIHSLDFNPSDANCSSSNNCLAKNLGSAGKLYYGRLAPVNGYGSELSAITVNQRLELYNKASNQYTVNTFDTCSQLAISAFELRPDGGAGAMKIGNGSSILSLQTINAGLYPLVFSSPGEGNTGPGRFTIDLLNTLPWLRYDWDENSILDDTVSGSITFGIYKGSQRLIYKKEQGI